MAARPLPGRRLSASAKDSGRSSRKGHRPLDREGTVSFLTASSGRAIGFRVPLGGRIRAWLRGIGIVFARHIVRIAAASYLVELFFLQDILYLFACFLVSHLKHAPLYFICQLGFVLFLIRSRQENITGKIKNCRAGWPEPAGGRLAAWLPLLA